jgi:hypothetical protein
MEKLLTKSDKISDDIKIALSLRDTSWTEIKCYEPRHGIVGRDKEGGIVWYIEICFECRNMRVFGRIEPRFAAKYLCQEQFALLRTLFLPEESPPAADKKRKKPR